MNTIYSVMLLMAVSIFASLGYADSCTKKIISKTQEAYTCSIGLIGSEDGVATYCGPRGKEPCLNKSVPDYPQSSAIDKSHHIFPMTYRVSISITPPS